MVLEFAARPVSQRCPPAAGGIASGAGVAAALATGASAAQIGSALMLTPEAGTNEAHRAAFAADAPTALTRAFTGCRARGITNRFMHNHDAAAPKGYPHVHYLTAPLRAAARASGDADGINLWAGQAYRLSQVAPAAELIERWGTELAAARCSPHPRRLGWHLTIVRNGVCPPTVPRVESMAVDRQRGPTRRGSWW